MRRYGHHTIRYVSIRRETIWLFSIRYDTIRYDTDNNCKNTNIHNIHIFFYEHNRGMLRLVSFTNTVARFTKEWTVPQLSIMIIYNSTWSILIQQIRIILSGDNLTQKTQKRDQFTSLHKIKANTPHWAEFETLRNGALDKTNLFVKFKKQYTVEVLNKSVKKMTC